MSVKKKLVILGLNSGTSADGLDLALLQLSGSGNRTSIKWLGGSTKKYPEKLRTDILNIADSKTVNLDHLVRLDNALGIFTGRAAKSFINKIESGSIKIDAIASHGQTVRHLTEFGRAGGINARGSLQIGSPEQIATITGKVTVADFRQAEIALGGEGAPVTVDALRRLIPQTGKSELLLNIGGMSNYFYFSGSNKKPIVKAADCGPGNVLLDILSNKLFNEKFDRFGRNASNGNISQRLMTLLRGLPYFAGNSHSTGREQFGVQTVQKIISLGKKLKLSDNDLLATATELTVYAVCRAIEPILKKDQSLTKLYLTGGGVHNKFLCRRLQECMPSVEVLSVAQLGLNPDLIEAASYALLGYSALRSEKRKTVAGKSLSRWLPVSGRIIQPPQIV